uniref:ER membrane protein complex subunit 3 n=1 Tax=Glossina palpalis gambiensis TaxID=67801 RepID=A0A1B0BVS8_9MUSC
MILFPLLCENCWYLTAHSYIARKHFFTNEENGYFKTRRRMPVLQNSTTIITHVVKSNFINVLPMVVIRGWINWMFSNLVTTNK